MTHIFNFPKTVNIYSVYIVVVVLIQRHHFNVLKMGGYCHLVVRIRKTGDLAFKKNTINEQCSNLEDIKYSEFRLVFKYKSFIGRCASYIVISNEYCNLSKFESEVFFVSCPK